MKFIAQYKNNHRTRHPLTAIYTNYQQTAGVCEVRPTWNMILILSSGAVHVLDTAPARPPATRWRHHMPVLRSLLVNSGGTVSESPMSIIW